MHLNIDGLGSKFMYLFVFILFTYLHVEDMSGTMNSTTKCISSDMTDLS